MKNNNDINFDALHQVDIRTVPLDELKRFLKEEGFIHEMVNTFVDKIYVYGSNSIHVN